MNFGNSLLRVSSWESENIYPQSEDRREEKEDDSLSVNFQICIKTCFLAYL